jgi:hypothetical protein
MGAVFLAAAALAALAPAAQARNVRLMEPLADTLRDSRAHEIVGNLGLRFGGSTAQGAEILRRDVVVTGTGATKLNDVGEDDKVRPSDHDLCRRAFEDAVTQLAFSARAAHAGAIVGVVSDYEDQVFDDPDHFECHAGTLKAYVTLRAQLARTAAAPVPAVSPPPPPPAPEPDSGPGPTFRPLPPAPSPSN